MKETRATTQKYGARRRRRRSQMVRWRRIRARARHSIDEALVMRLAGLGLAITLADAPAQRCAQLGHVSRAAALSNSILLTMGGPPSAGAFPITPKGLLPGLV